MEKTKSSFYDRLETIFKIATPIGAIIAFFIGLYHYRDSQAEEFKKAYWEKRYHVYEEISYLSSQIANAKKVDELDSMKRQFWIAYTGKSMLVERLHVYDAMKSFGASLNRSIYPDSLPILATKAQAISRACRTSLKETWEPVPVSELKSMEN